MTELTHIDDLNDPVVREDIERDIWVDVDVYGKLMTTVEVRSVFALSEAELSDETLTQRIYTRAVSSDITATAPKLAADWARISSSSDPKDKAIVTAVEQFAVYSLSKEICEILPMVVARLMDDSKAKFQRYDSDLEQVAKSINLRYLRYKSQLMDLMEEQVNNSMTVTTMFRRSRPSFDPVTNEGAE